MNKKDIIERAQKKIEHRRHVIRQIALNCLLLLLLLVIWGQKKTENR